MPERELRVNADKSKIEQILSNIIDNAIKYTKEGSVEISAWADHDKAEIAVKDTGTGIEPKEADRLFEKEGTAYNADDLVQAVQHLFANR